jgi:hypothetical protein
MLCYSVDIFFNILSEQDALFHSSLIIQYVKLYSDSLCLGISILPFWLLLSFLKSFDIVVFVFCILFSCSVIISKVNFAFCFDTCLVSKHAVCDVLDKNSVGIMFDDRSMSLLNSCRICCLDVFPLCFGLAFVPRA